MLKFLQRWELPLLARELADSAGRSRTYVLRACYAGMIAVAGSFTWWTLLPDLSKNTIANLDVGPIVGYWAYFYQALALQWFWPIIACTAITIERERNTLTTLLVTRLSPLTIILEKFFSRLLLASTFLLTCLPLFAFCFLQGNASLVFFCKFPTLLMLSAIEITAIAMLCSAYFRSTVGALIGTYIGVGLSRCVSAVVSVAFATNHLGLTLTKDQLTYGLIANLTPAPLGGGGAYASYLTPMSDQGVTLSTYQGFWSVTVPVFLAIYLPPLVISAIALWLASRFLIRQGQPARQGSSLKDFVDRVGTLARRANQNPVTRGRVVIQEGRREPDNDPVAWRESITRALAQPRYLIGNLLVLEVPIIWFLLAAGMQVSGPELVAIVANMQLCLWGGMLLMVCFVVSGVIVEERQHQTLELLLSTPIPRQEIVLQKRAGIERMLWILQAPLWTCLLFRLALGGPLIYVLNEAGMLLLYPRIMAWLAIHSSLKKKSRLAAVVDTLGTVAIWIAVGSVVGLICVDLLLLIQHHVFAVDADAKSPTLSHIIFAPLLLSPLTLLYGDFDLSAAEYFQRTLIPCLVSVVISLTALRWFKNRCLNDAERFLHAR